MHGEGSAPETGSDSLKDCIVAEHDDTLLICQLKEEQWIKEWHD